MTQHGQPSAPSYHGNLALWTESPDNVPPLFDYELYRQSRSRDPSFKFDSAENAAARTSGSDLATVVNSYYESPHDRLGMNRYANPPVQAALGPPLLMTGGGYDNSFHQGGYDDNSFHKGVRQQQYFGGNWNCAPTQNCAPTRGSSQRQLDVGGRENYDEEAVEHKPFLSVSIAVVHIVILILTMQQNDCPNHTTQRCLNPSLHRFALQPFSENPLLGPSARTLISMGGVESDLITKANEGWRIITSMWLHAGVLQILGTCLGMALLGMPLERQLGFAKVAVIYFMSGLMGSILSALMVHGRVSAGASGAFMGLLGATLSAVIIKWDSYPNRSLTLMAIIFFVALNTVYGLMPLVDNFMHVGGALVGFLVGNLFLIRPNADFRCWNSPAVYDQDDMPAKQTNAIILNLVWLLSFGVLFAACIMGLYGLFSGKNIADGCSWCEYLTCAPSHFWKCSKNQHMPCNPTSIAGLLQVTCANGHVLNFPSVSYVSEITPQVQAICVKACI